jgi:apolipoprotein N-acyltransferase
LGSWSIWILDFLPLQREAVRGIGHQQPKRLILLRVLIGTALWCGLEAFWSGGSLWWSSLSYTQSPHNLPILHLGQISGPATVTAAIIAVNGLLAEALSSYLRSKARKANREQDLKSHNESLTYLSAAVGLLVALHLIGLALYSRPLIQPTATALKVGIIQGNIGNDIKLFTEGKRRALENTPKAIRNWQTKVLMLF